MTKNTFVHVFLRRIAPQLGLFTGLLFSPSLVLLAVHSDKGFLFSDPDGVSEMRLEKMSLRESLMSPDLEVVDSAEDDASVTEDDGSLDTDDADEDLEEPDEEEEGEPESELSEGMESLRSVLVEGANNVMTATSNFLKEKQSDIAEKDGLRIISTYSKASNILMNFLGETPSQDTQEEETQESVNLWPELFKSIFEALPDPLSKPKDKTQETQEQGD